MTEFVHIDWCESKGPYMDPDCSCPCLCDYDHPERCPRYEASSGMCYGPCCWQERDVTYNLEHAIGKRTKESPR